MQPYSPRKTWFVDVREIHGWKLKVYGIVAPQCELSADVQEAAVHHAEANVDWSTECDWPYGFLTLHVGEHAVWLLVDLWADDIMRHFLFRADIESGTTFSPAGADGTTACVWELEVIKHERDAWVRHVLATPATPNFDGYLNDRLTVDPVTTN